MKRLLTNYITNSVGLPLTSAALDLLQDEHKEILTTVVKNSFLGASDDGLAHFLIPLTGIFTTTTTFNENLIYKNGELYYMPTQTLATSSIANCYFYIDTYYGITDPIKYTDSSHNYTLQNNSITVAIGSGATAPIGHVYTLLGHFYDITAAPDLADYPTITSMNTAISNYFIEENWHLIPSGSTFFNVGGSECPLRYKKDKSGYLIIEGVIIVNSTGTMYTLTGGYIPTYTHRIALSPEYIITSPTQDPVNLVINSDGTLVLQCSTSFAGYPVKFGINARIKLD